MSDLLDELLIKASDATHPPPDPKGGVPKQWVPGWIRHPVKCALLPFVLLDYHIQRFAKKCIRPPFKQEGGCKRRGNCCHYVLIRYSSSLIGRLFYFWYTQFLGFYPRLKEPQEYEGKKMHVMGCRYLKKDGSCGQYHLRPLICRQWPMIEYFGYPKILKGCGYRSNPPYPPEIPDGFENKDPRLKVIQ